MKELICVTYRAYIAYISITVILSIPTLVFLLSNLQKCVVCKKWTAWSVLGLAMCHYHCKQFRKNGYPDHFDIELKDVIETLRHLDA